MAYPSTYTSFNRPTSTDRLNSPSHSALHNTVSSAVGQIEQTIGLSTSSLVGTLYYDIRSPDSNGGGHVQTANKGGTGQTSYTKGDVLVASSASVLTKLSVGTDGQIIKANSSVATGITWANNETNKVAISASVISSGTSTVAETSIFSITIPGSTLGTSNAVRARVFVKTIEFGESTASVMLKANYGSNTIASVVLGAQTGISPTGFIEFNLLANANEGLQRGVVHIDIKKASQNFTAIASTFGVQTTFAGSSSINSSASQTLGITNKYSTSHAANLLTVDGYTVEKIV